MGFRSTLTTSDYNVVWPPWFVEKYKECLTLGRDGHGPLGSLTEVKIYFSLPDLVTDIHKVLQDSFFTRPRLSPFELVYLHECGGITRVELYKDEIHYSEPTGWATVPWVTHDYCDGCSDAPPFRQPPVPDKSNDSGSFLEFLRNEQFGY